MTLKSHSPREVLRSLPSEDLFMMILDAEPEDMELAIQYASEEQHRDIIDFSVWEKDEICPELVMEWLTRLLKCDERKLMKVIAKLDSELLIYTFKYYIQVFLHEDQNEPIPDCEDATSPPKSVDSSFYYFHLKDDFVETIDAIILHIFGYEYSVYFSLMQGCQHELSLELMEYAFRWRSGRMEEKGFLNYIDSKTILTVIDNKELKKLKHYPGKEVKILCVSEKEAIVSHFYFFGISDASFFRKTFGNLKDREGARELERGIVLTMNKLIAASLSSMNDMKEIRDCLKKGMDTLSLSLDYLSNGRPEAAVEFLEEMRIETLFQVGYSLTVNLRRRLTRFFQNSNILTTETLFLLGSPAAESLSGILQSPPLFYDGKVVDYVNFETVEQVDFTASTIREAECLDHLFYEQFKLQIKEIGKIDINKLYQDELTFSTLFISGICNIILNRHFEFSSIPAVRLKEIIQKAFQNTGGKFKLSDEYVEEFRKWRKELTLEWGEEDRKLIESLLSSWIMVFTEEFSSVGFSDKIDPRYIKTLLVRRGH